MHSIVSNYSLSISSCSIFKKIIVTFSEPLFFVYIIVLELWRSPNYRLATVTFENVLVTKEFLSHFTIRICTVLGMRGKRRWRPFLSFRKLESAKHVHQLEKWNWWGEVTRNCSRSGDQEWIKPSWALSNGHLRLSSSVINQFSHRMGFDRNNVHISLRFNTRRTTRTCVYYTLRLLNTRTFRVPHISNRRRDERGSLPPAVVRSN